MKFKNVLFWGGAILATGFLALRVFTAIDSGLKSQPVPLDDFEPDASEFV